MAGAALAPKAGKSSSSSPRLAVFIVLTVKEKEIRQHSEGLAGDDLSAAPAILVGLFALTAKLLASHDATRLFRGQLCN